MRNEIAFPIKTRTQLYRMQHAPSRHLYSLSPRQIDQLCGVADVPFVSRAIQPAINIAKMLRLSHDAVLLSNTMHYISISVQSGAVFHWSKSVEAFSSAAVIVHPAQRMFSLSPRRRCTPVEDEKGCGGVISLRCSSRPRKTSRGGKDLPWGATGEKIPLRGRLRAKRCGNMCAAAGPKDEKLFFIVIACALQGRYWLQKWICLSLMVRAAFEWGFDSERWKLHDAVEIVGCCFPHSAVIVSLNMIYCLIENLLQ